MLAHRIIPTILMKNGHLVKGTAFAADRIVGNALQAARIHAMRGVDEILILDVSATKEGREPDYGMIEKLTSSTTVPVTVGGGVRHMDYVQNLLNAGADKVCVGSVQDIIEFIAERYGSQCVTYSLDHHEIDHSKYTLDLDIVYRELQRAEDLGVGEILLQNKDRDGTMQGYDLETIACVSEAADVPVIASGGCSGYQDMLAAINAGASAVAAGALFLFTNATPRGAAEYLHSHDVEVRL